MERISATVDEADVEKLDKIRKKMERRTKSDTIRQLIREYEV